jgi:ESX secretion-associated protein EspJ
MSGDPLYVQPDGVRSYAQTHDEVVAALSQVMGTAPPEAAGVQTTHGPIASAVSGALSQVLGSRHGTLQATSTSAQTISELLQKAAQMYEHGDQKGAATLKAAAEAMQNANSSGGASGTGGAGAAGAGPPGAGGADTMGQMVSQVGQVAQSIAQPLQGIAQGLQQVPQQVMQGAQLAQQVSQAARTVSAKAPGEGAGPEGRFPEEKGDHAAAGDAGRAPDLPPVQRAEPAQTRPQSD